MWCGQGNLKGWMCGADGDSAWKGMVSDDALRMREVDVLVLMIPGSWR